MEQATQNIEEQGEEQIPVGEPAGSFELPESLPVLPLRETVARAVLGESSGGGDEELIAWM